MPVNNETTTSMSLIPTGSLNYSELVMPAICSSRRSCSKISTSELYGMYLNIKKEIKLTMKEVKNRNTCLVILIVSKNLMFKLAPL